MTYEELTQVEKFFRDKMDEAHAGQKRRDGTPFRNHPNRVGNAHGDNRIRQAVGYGHDILEDTEVTAMMLRHEFERLLVLIEPAGDLPSLRARRVLQQKRRIDFRQVMDLIQVLTHDKENESYLEYLTRVRDAGPDAIAVKRADILDNLNDRPTAIEMVKYPAALLFLAGLDGDSPGELLRILGAGKKLQDAGKTLKI